MKLRLVYSGSQGGGCPTVYETDQGDNVVVQGDLLTDTEALGGGLAGNNGLKSIRAHLHTDDFAWHHSFFGWADLMREGVLGDYLQHRPASHPPPHTQCAMGQYTARDHRTEKHSSALNFIRSAKAPVMSAGVIAANIN